MNGRVHPRKSSFAAVTRITREVGLVHSFASPAKGTRRRPRTFGSWLPAALTVTLRLAET